ncbi:Uncharacterised protein [Mycobacteroides abscessus subsp. abscessus]|nr:Uncharacterised protein [Mycobacteroides abscessus subsp. abscessus]
MLPAQRARPDPCRDVGEHGHARDRDDEPPADPERIDRRDSGECDRRGLAGDAKEHGEPDVGGARIQHRHEPARTGTLLFDHVFDTSDGHRRHRGVDRGEHACESEQYQSDDEEPDVLRQGHVSLAGV